jgi:phospholipase/lecithinase/hemolysin
MELLSPVASLSPMPANARIEPGNADRFSMRAIFLILTLAFTAALRAGEFSAVVAFGDSLTDMGNRWIKSPDQQNKIRSTWVRQLAGPTMLGIGDFKVAGMASYLGGTNYAVGGATTEFTAKMGSDRNRGQNLTEQISQRYLNPAFNTDGVKKDALHVIVMGTNDVMLASIGLEQIAKQWADFDKVGVAVAQSVEAQIGVLAKAGVTRVMWGNLFDVGKAPSVVTKAKMLGGNMAAAYFAALTKAVVAHNVEMDAAIQRLIQAHPALRIIKLDLHAKFAEVIAEPAKFGFVNANTGANDAQHLFSADGLHPTPQGHKMLAEYAYSVLTQEKPKPNTSEDAKPAGSSSSAGTEKEKTAAAPAAR